MIIPTCPLYVTGLWPCEILGGEEITKTSQVSAYVIPTRKWHWQPQLKDQLC